MLVPAPKTGEAVVDGTKLPSTVPQTPPSTAEGAGDNEGNNGPLPKDNPFDQYYSQLTHQQNMLQDSVRVTAYQRAILENAADFKVRPLASQQQRVARLWQRCALLFGFQGDMKPRSGGLKRANVVRSPFPLACREYGLPMTARGWATTRFMYSKLSFVFTPMRPLRAHRYFRGEMSPR